MKNILFSLIFFVSIAGMCGCARNEAVYRSEVDKNGEYSPSFAQFNDIPIPENARMDLRATLLLGSTDTWTGRLAFSAPYGLNYMFDFYMNEMPKFGWKEETLVRSKVSVLSFTNAGRVATIQLEQDMVNDTIVSFTVSPRSKEKKTK